MDVAAVTQALIKVHREMQSDAGNDPDAVDETTCPLGGLPGFDSLLVPDAIRSVAQELGRDLPEGTKITNIYCSKDGGKKLSIGDIAKRFSEHYV
jgi:hypothetical protein